MFFFIFSQLFFLLKESLKPGENTPNMNINSDGTLMTWRLAIFLQGLYGRYGIREDLYVRIHAPDLTQKTKRADYFQSGERVKVPEQS